MIHKMYVFAICYVPLFNSFVLERIELFPSCLCLMSTLRCLPLSFSLPRNAAVGYFLWHTMSPVPWKWGVGGRGLGDCGSDVISGSPYLFLLLDLVLSCSCVELSLCTLLDALAGRGQVGDWEAAAPFLAGGCGGLLYQFSLQAGVDALPSPHEARLARSCWEDSADGLVLHSLHDRAQQLTVSV